MTTKGTPMPFEDAHMQKERLTVTDLAGAVALGCSPDVVKLVARSAADQVAIHRYYTDKHSLAGVVKDAITTYEYELNNVRLVKYTGIDGEYGIQYATLDESLAVLEELEKKGQ